MSKTWWIVWSCVLLLVFLPEAGAVRFAVLADLHVSPGNRNQEQLQKAVAEINAGDFDFVVVPGDLTNQGSEAELGAVKQVLDRLRVPTFAVPGNHETNWSPTAAQGWIRRWGGERVDEWVGDVHVVGFSTGPYLKMGDGFVRPDDLAWLKKTLRGDRRAETTLLLAHYPLTDGVGNWAEVQQILREYPVAAVIGGHWHRINLFNYHGIPGILSRSLEMDGNFGYGVMEVTPEEVVYSEKITGGALLERMRLRRDDPSGWPEANPLPAIRKKSGLPDQAELIWRDPATIYTAAAVHGDICWFGTSEGLIKAVNWRAKQLLWSREVGGAVYSTPVYVEGVLVVGSSQNSLTGLDAASGEELWRVPTAAPVTADGAVADGVFYIGDSAGVFYGIVPESGKVLFRKQIAQARFQARPWIARGMIYAPAWDGYLYALRADTGEVIWRWTHDKSSRLYSPGNSTPVLSGDRLFVATPDRFLNAIDVATGATEFSSKEYRYRESIGISEDGKTIYGKTMDGEIAAVSADSPDGKADWAVPLGWTQEHTPCPELEWRGTIYAGSRQGDIAMIETTAPHAVNRFRVAQSAVNGFTPLADGSVLATLIEGVVIRLHP